jgi:hypothetical protein
MRRPPCTTRPTSGSAGSVFSADIERAISFARRISTGEVLIDGKSGAPNGDLVRNFYKHGSLGGGMDLIPGYQLINCSAMHRAASARVGLSPAGHRPGNRCTSASRVASNASDGLASFAFRPNETPSRCLGRDAPCYYL